MSVKNTSELRELLLKTIEDVRSGVVEPKKATAISNLSGKILYSAKLDLEVAKYEGASGRKVLSGDQTLQLTASSQNGKN